MTSSIPHCKLKKKSKFQIKRAHFSLVFPTYVLFCTHIVVLYSLRLFSSQLFYLTLKSCPTCSASVCTPFTKSPTINRPQRSTKASIYADKVSIFESSSNH